MLMLEGEPVPVHLRKRDKPMTRFLLTSALAATLALPALAATPNQIISVDGLGEGGYAWISPGLGTNDGAGEIILAPGENAGGDHPMQMPDDEVAYIGHVIFRLHTTAPNRDQTCNFGHEYKWDQDDYPPNAAYYPWSHGSQIGRAGSDPATSEVKLYFRTDKRLKAGKWYGISFVCPPPGHPLGQ
jgi:hypothetical protein